MKTQALVVGVGLLMLAGACSVDQDVAAAEEALAGAEAQLAAVTAERDALARQAAARTPGHEKAAANANRIQEIIDSPDAFGTREAVLDELTAMATADAVMDDTAFGSVPIRQAWSNTLWGSNATIKTWTTWMCSDGSQSGSLWTWSGESQAGEPFDLIGVNVDQYDDAGRVTYSLIDWPYDGSYVRQVFAFGNTAGG